MSNNTIPSNEHSISLERAIQMTRRFRENRDKILNIDVLGKDILPTCETFNRDAFTSFFENPEVKGLRIYYGMSENLQIHAIIVGVNEKNEDMLPASTIGGVEPTVTSTITDVTLSADDPTEPTEPTPVNTPLIVEDSSRCPPYCPPASPLVEP